MPQDMNDVVVENRRRNAQGEQVLRIRYWSCLNITHFKMFEWVVTQAFVEFVGYRRVVEIVQNHNNGGLRIVLKVGHTLKRKQRVLLAAFIQLQLLKESQRLANLRYMNEAAAGLEKNSVVRASFGLGTGKAL